MIKRYTKRNEKLNKMAVEMGFQAQVPEINRTEVIYCRVTKGMYEAIVKGSLETGVSLSKLAELCIEEKIDEVISRFKVQEK
jgi:viroplasmin and RNaseH domain-containing protein